MGFCSSENKGIWRRITMVRATHRRTLKYGTNSWARLSGRGRLGVWSHKWLWWSAGIGHLLWYYGRLIPPPCLQVLLAQVFHRCFVNAFGFGQWNFYAYITGPNFLVCKAISLRGLYGTNNQTGTDCRLWRKILNAGPWKNALQHQFRAVSRDRNGKRWMET